MRHCLNMNHLRKLAFAVLISLCFNSADATVSEQTFEKVSPCPSSQDLTQWTTLPGVMSRAQALSRCAIRLNCSVTHCGSTGECYIGDETQLEALLSQSEARSSAACCSYAKSPLTALTLYRISLNRNATAGSTAQPQDPTGPATPTAATTASTKAFPPIPAIMAKLVVFFDFRRSFANLANPGEFDSQSFGSVFRNSQGAHFSGACCSDYIEVQTNNGSLVSNYLESRQNFSFFAKVFRQTYYQQTYHYFYDCSSVLNAGRFGDRDGRAWVEHQFPSLTDWTETIETRQSSSEPFLLANKAQAASLGAAFVGKSLSRFWLNGSDLLMDVDLRYTLNAQPRCLRLGFDSESDRPLKGRMLCYAIAKVALSSEDFQQLDELCNN